MTKQPYFLQSLQQMSIGLILWKIRILFKSKIGIATKHQLNYMKRNVRN